MGESALELGKKINHPTLQQHTLLTLERLNPVIYPNFSLTLTRFFPNLIFSDQDAGFLGFLSIQQHCHF